MKWTFCREKLLL